MFKIDPASLDLALTHVMSRGDTDILPPSFEFNAIFDDWVKIRTTLAHEDLDAWAVRPFRRFLSPKRELGFRVATQLDPLDTLLITALIYEIGQELEDARIPRSKETILSYRFSPDQGGQLYSSQPNFETFRLKSLELAHDHGGMVVITDISDFFNRAYIHPLENALTSYCSSPDHIRIILKLLNQWNQNVSYGMPVGPAAFRLLAEVLIADVDETLLLNNLTFCRYSDDYRLFVPDERAARESLVLLADTLFKNHGLTLQESKTRIVAAETFVEMFGLSEADRARRDLQDRFDSLAGQLMSRQRAALIDSFNEGGQEAVNRLINEGDPEFEFYLATLDSYAEIEYEDLSPDLQEVVDSLNLWEALRSMGESGELDIAMSKFILRRIAQLGLQDPDDILLRNARTFYPVFPRWVEAMAVQGEGAPQERERLGSALLDLMDDPVIGHLGYHRLWILSIFAGSPEWNNVARVQDVYRDYNDELTRPEVVCALGTHSLTAWLRSAKRDFASLPVWERRRFLMAAATLPKDERNHWYRAIAMQLDPLETSIVGWVRGQGT